MKLFDFLHHLERRHLHFKDNRENSFKHKLNEHEKNDNRKENFLFSCSCEYRSDQIISLYEPPNYEY